MQTKPLNQNWRDFIKLCLKAKTEKRLTQLFNLMLTDAEQKDIATRLAIIMSLLSGEKTQRELAKQFEISIAKITRGSTALKIAEPQIKKLISN